MEASDQKSSVTVSETTWLENIVEMSCRNLPNGQILLTYVLGNGHRYVLPLQGEALEATRRAVSPIVVAGADSMPSGNGHQAL
jgi:hypothetical protein